MELASVFPAARRLAERNTKVRPKVLSAPTAGCRGVALSGVTAAMALLNDARDEFAQHVWQVEQAKLASFLQVRKQQEAARERELTGNSLLQAKILKRCWERWVRLAVATGRDEMLDSSKYNPTLDDLDHFLTYNFHNREKDSTYQIERNAFLKVS